MTRVSWQVKCNTPIIFARCDLASDVVKRSSGKGQKNYGKPQTIPSISDPPWAFESFMRPARNPKKNTTSGQVVYVTNKSDRSHPQFGAGDIPTPINTSTSQAASVLQKCTPAPCGTMRHHAAPCSSWCRDQLCNASGKCCAILGASTPKIP